MKKNNNVVKKICILALSISFVCNATAYAEAAIIWAGQGGGTTPPIIVADMATAEQPTQMPAMVNTVDNVAVTNGGAEETMKFPNVGGATDWDLQCRGIYTRDSGLTRAQVMSMTMAEGAAYIEQLSKNYDWEKRESGNLFLKLWKQILKEEFPEVLGSATGYRSWMLSSGVDGEGKYWMVSLLMDRHDEYGRYFMNEDQTGTIKCYTFAEARTAVKKCDDILRSKGIY